MLDVTMVPGEATAPALTSPEFQNFETVTVLYKPGFSGMWEDVVVLNHENMLVTLIDNGAVIDD